MYKSLNSRVLDPRSLAPSVEGTMSLSNLAVAVIVSEVALPRSIVPLKTDAPVTVRSPETVTVSSIATVPPAESKVRLPEEVSISLLPVIPIWILSIVAPPLASIAPVNVDAPVIVVTPEILTLSRSA